MPLVNNILVVCIGNICRSPMGEALLKEKLNSSQETYKIASAGIDAMVGWSADPVSCDLMKDRGIDISEHRAQQLTLELARQYDLILTMEEFQQQRIRYLMPAVYGKVHCLGKWGNFEIPDPYKKPKEHFEKALSLIDRGINDWCAKLISL